jgi:diacylglycerol kinase
MKKFIKSFGYAFKGLAAAWKDQHNLKVQAVMGTLVIIAGFYFQIHVMEWYVILIVIGIVLSLELINTALESLVDLVTQEHLPLAGKIKDIAAGAVLMFSIIAAIIGVLIFGKYIL